MLLWYSYGRVGLLGAALGGLDWLFVYVLVLVYATIRVRTVKPGLVGEILMSVCGVQCGFSVWIN